MVRSSLRLAICLVLLAAARSSVHAQTHQLHFDDLRSNNDTSRARAFYRILHGRPSRLAFTAKDYTLAVLRVHTAESELTKEALIALLVRENGRARLGLNGAFGRYYLDVITSVAALSDSRAAEALVNTVYLPGSDARRGLAALGESAIPAVLGAMTHATRNTRNMAIHVAGLLAANRSPLELSSNGRATLRNALLERLADPAVLNRAAAIEVLRAFSDPEVRAAVTRLATNDGSAVVRRHAANYARDVR